LKKRKILEIFEKISQVSILKVEHYGFLSLVAYSFSQRTWLFIFEYLNYLRGKRILKNI